MSNTILIPAYKPDNKLITYVKALVKYGFKDIIVVNDGSPRKYNRIFSQLAPIKQCTLLKYSENHGKGYALKHGFRYIIDRRPDCTAVVTCDADGQHTLKDTAAVFEEVNAHPDSVVLGVRNFNEENIPARSRFGNKTTSVVFKLFYSYKISDTQTGLRGIPARMLPLFVATEGNRYEYEMNMLIMCSDRSIPIREVPIETVYIDDNKSSHFRPVRDSIRIYALILKKFVFYMLSGLFSYIIEYLIFIGLFKYFFPTFFPDFSTSGRLLASLGVIGISNCIARVISTIVNYFTNKIMVFKKSGDTAKSGVRFFLLAAIMMVASSLFISLFSKYLLPMIDAAYIKPIVDFFLMLVNYYVQRVWVFKKGKDEI